ncbi:hypothetical protein WG68_14345 [Arsukibacterium ikkense]|uniref:Uncharacterized protein n=1 Tax=Arsukibacterium ikkense TaxID=336831 RepID=A0A0M2V503_9GAMM|nr:hypothetical protein WG68_14345 [Arsukibacterium ikkense]
MSYPFLLLNWIKTSSKWLRSRNNAIKVPEYTATIFQRFKTSAGSWPSWIVKIPDTYVNKIQRLHQILLTAPCTEDRRRRIHKAMTA